MKARHLILKLGVSLIGTVILVFGFQNCAKINFGKDYGSSVLEASLGVADVFYTNSKVVPVTVNLDSPYMNQIRASIYPDMDAQKIAWQVWNSGTSGKINVDLGDQYAADGSKDGPKDLYVEARDSANNKKTQVILKAFLDTQSPTINGLDLLVNGTQGKVYSKGQSVDLKWNAQDVIAKSGMSSGIDPDKGFRWGVASSGDCSESSLTQKSDWMAANGSISVSWPGSNPLEAFYFCLYTKDRAGNIANLLSQPMTSLWSVIAGDNSQGNGSSVTSSKVRFKNPYYFSRDPQGNLHFVDSAFGVQRVIKAFANDASRTIEKSPLIFNQAMVYDHAGYAYTYRSWGGLIQISPDSKSQKVIMTGGTSVKLAIRNYKGVERLLISHGGGTAPYTAATKSFLMEVPIATINAMSTSLTLDQMISQYKIAGNGIVPWSKEGYPAEVILTANDPADRDHSLGYMQEVAASNAGDIFIATHADGGGLGQGNQTVRRLTPQADGSFKQTILSTASWVVQMAYHQQVQSDGSNSEYLFLARAFEANAIDLHSGVMSAPFAELSARDYNTGIAVLPSVDGKDFEIYIGSSTQSKIFRYDSKFKLIEALGRPVYDESITNALAAVLGNPDGLASDPSTGDIYVMDSQNSVVQKVDRSGNILKVAGAYAPNAAYLIGYRSRITGDFDIAKNRKVLFYGSGGQLNAVDLLAKTEASLSPPAPTSPLGNAKYNWGTESVALVKGANDQNMILSVKYWNVVSNESWHAPYTAFVNQINLNGTSFIDNQSFLGDITKGEKDLMLNTGIMNNSSVVMGQSMDKKIAVDSQNNIFISGHKMLLGRVGDTTSQVLSSLFISGAFVVLEDKNLRYIVFPTWSGGLAVSTVDLSLRGDVAKDPVISVKALCLAGTSLSGVSELIQDADGNIILSDANNARVLKYRVRNPDGSLNFSYCP